MVVVKLVGGLGNQMFQYAAARAVAKRLNSELVLDIGEFQDYNLRRYELNKFTIECRIATSEDLLNLEKNNVWFKWFKSFIKSVDSKKTKNFYKEEGFTYNKKIQKLNSPIYLDGYWQSEKYFLDITEIIRKDFTLKQPLNNANLKLLDKIKNPFFQSISLHIRRGDYVSNLNTAQFHGICSLDYYHSAIKFLSTQIKNPHFFIFSDDPDWVKENLFFGHPMTIVDVNSADNGVFDMILMKFCKHHVIANSTFSWWGAWLNSNKDKIVIAPKKWFKGANLDTSDLIPSGWVRL